MKILHIVSSMELGGIENLVFSLLRADVTNVYVFAIAGSREEALEEWPALIPYSENLIFADKKAHFRYGVVKLIKETCQKHSISIIHSHHIGPLIYGSLASKALKSIKHVHTQHDIWHLKYRKQWLIEYCILSIRKDIHLIAVSTEIDQELNRLFPKNKISLVYNGIDTDRFKPGNKPQARALLKLPLNALIIAHAGRLEEVKGQRYLVDAMNYLPNEYYLAIAGRGSCLPTLLEESKKQGLSDRICFLNQIDDVELLYQASDLFCLPSIDEGLPLAVLEAQACDLPVICSNVGSCADGIDPKTGCLIPPKDSKAIATACLELSNTTKHPRDFVLTQFSLAVLIEKYYQIYALP